MQDGDRSAGSSLASSSNTQGQANHHPTHASKRGTNQSSSDRGPLVGGPRQPPRGGEDEDDTEYSLDDFEGGGDSHPNPNHAAAANSSNTNTRRPGGSAEPAASSSGKQQGPGPDSEEQQPSNGDDNDTNALESIKRRWLAASSMDELAGPSLSVPQSRGE